MRKLKKATDNHNPVYLFKDSRRTDIQVVNPYNKANISNFLIEIKYIEGQRALVIIYDVETLNRGMSVTNAIEYVADYIKDNYLSSYNPGNILWVESYTKYLDDDYTLVALTHDGQKYKAPKWASLKSREDVIKLTHILIIKERG